MRISLIEGGLVRRLAGEGEESIGRKERGRSRGKEGKRRGKRRRKG